MNNSKRSPDVLATVTFLSSPDGGRSDPVYSGYRPAHRVRKDYLTSGIHRYVDLEFVNPSQTACAEIYFVTPDAYPHCLSVGQVITLQEGARIVGYAEILTVYNPILKAP